MPRLQGQHYCCVFFLFRRSGAGDLLDFHSLNVCQLCFIDGLCQMPFWQSSLGWGALLGRGKAGEDRAVAMPHHCLCKPCCTSTRGLMWWWVWQGFADTSVCVCVCPCDYLSHTVSQNRSPAWCHDSDHNWQAESRLTFTPHTYSNTYLCRASPVQCLTSAVLQWEDKALQRHLADWVGESKDFSLILSVCRTIQNTCSIQNDFHNPDS